MDIGATYDISIIDIKKIIKETLNLSAIGGMQRYSFLQENDKFQNSMIIYDKKEGIQIQIVFDKSYEIKTSNLMKKYMSQEVKL